MSTWCRCSRSKFIISFVCLFLDNLLECQTSRVDQVNEYICNMSYLLPSYLFWWIVQWEVPMVTATPDDIAYSMSRRGGGGGGGSIYPPRGGTGFQFLIDYSCSFVFIDCCLKVLLLSFLFLLCPFLFLSLAFLLILSPLLYSFLHPSFSLPPFSHVWLPHSSNLPFNLLD